MICSECKNNNAAFFYQQTVNGKTTEMNLCRECAAKHGLFTGTSLFSDLFNIPSFIKAPGIKSSKKLCSLCGMDETSFIKNGKVSCPVCYETFAEELYSPIKRIHGNVSHIGRAPSKFKKQNDKLKLLSELRAKLKDAIEKEVYEDAAVLRDKIKEVENDVDNSL